MSGRPFQTRLKCHFDYFIRETEIHLAITTIFQREKNLFDIYKLWRNQRKLIEMPCASVLSAVRINRVLAVGRSFHATWWISEPSMKVYYLPRSHLISQMYFISPYELWRDQNDGTAREKTTTRNFSLCPVLFAPKSPFAFLSPHKTVCVFTFSLAWSRSRGTCQEYNMILFRDNIHRNRKIFLYCNFFNSRILTFKYKSNCHSYKLFNRPLLLNAGYLNEHDVQDRWTKWASFV